MNDNKYYQPELSEFHDGFEFEVKQEYGHWLPHIFGQIYSSTVSIDKMLKLDHIRVKFLDHEDIERAGWKQTDNHDDDLLTYQMQDLYFLTFNRKTGVSITQRMFDADLFNTLFNGTILNATELSFQMNRLNIKK